jgi:hypothetical protein
LAPSCKNSGLGERVGGGGREGGREGGKEGGREGGREGRDGGWEKGKRGKGIVILRTVPSIILVKPIFGINNVKFLMPEFVLHEI